MTPYDPEFDIPVKPKTTRRTPIDRRSASLLLLLTGLWLWIVWDTDLLWLTLMAVGMMLSGVLVIGLALIPSASGFALFGLCGRVVAYFRSNHQWSDGTSKGPD